MFLKQNTISNLEKMLEQFSIYSRSHSEKDSRTIINRNDLQY